MTVPVEVCRSPKPALSLRLVECRRGASGHWSLVLTIAGTVDLGDGRVLAVDREVRLLTRQRGRKKRK
jgi:hypothetical protein